MTQSSNPSNAQLKADAFLGSIGQILELKDIRTEESQTRYLKEKKELGRQLQAYFSGLLEQTNGRITPEIRELVDNLYVDGIASLLPDALGMTKGELTLLLAREREVICERCHHKYTVIERRKVGGYSGNWRSSMCDDCREMRDEAEQIEYERKIGDRRRRIALAALLIDKPNPLSLPIFVEWLEDLAIFWLSAQVLQSVQGLRLSSRSYALGGGCMICGAAPVRMFWTNDNQPIGGYPVVELLDQDDQGPFEFFLQQIRADITEEDLRFPPIIRPAQLVARLDAQQFFAGLPILPLRKQPLIFLCDDCVDLVQGTHTEVRPGGRYEPNKKEKR